ncbi:MAG: hypothetical protein AAB290_04835 [Candidatus Eisenbacteria bacterium]
MDDGSHPESEPPDTSSDLPVAPPRARQARSIWRWLGSGRTRRARLTFEVLRLPETTGAWLHVVSGPSATAVARGALELAARFLSGGHRVLIVDGGPRLQLHDRFDREARWGVIECLTGEMPVLGLVQDVGRLGLYLLAHGVPARRTHWPQLGRLMDEARPHFGRAVLALDADAPAAIGEALAGWQLEGWWAERGRATRPAARLADRLGIHLSDLDLVAMQDAKLEALDVRLWTLTALRAGVGTPAAPATDPAPVAPVAVPTVATTLDCDLRVRERLRFLLWMRHIQTEGQRPDPVRAPGAATVPSA